ncbi:hypothetical protein ACQP1O_16070 [Nocardia sp. CA-151230]|uniref:hypothetical protein n=1 Tax=Nocardia sp. CA-151230 TaxID=3239982 RepID=UPI003D8FB2CD
MSKIKKTAIAATLSVSALTVTAATVNAAPADNPPTPVHYEITSRDGSAILTTTDGLLKTVGDQLVLTDRDDRPAAAIPLIYRIDDTAYAITAAIEGQTATLAPSKNVVAAPHVPTGPTITTEQAATQIAESFNPRDSQALGTFAQRVSIGAGISAVLGAVLGAGVGCLVGGAAGAAISSPVIALLVPFVGATVAGCVLGAATLGAVGSMIGLVVAGGPITLFSAIQYFSTILAPCPPELAYCKDPAQPAPQAK